MQLLLLLYYFLLFPLKSSCLMYWPFYWIDCVKQMHKIVKILYTFMTRNYSWYWLLYVHVQYTYSVNLTKASHRPTFLIFFLCLLLQVSRVKSFLSPKKNILTGRGAEPHLQQQLCHINTVDIFSLNRNFNYTNPHSLLSFLWNGSCECSCAFRKSTIGFLAML